MRVSVTVGLKGKGAPLEVVRFTLYFLMLKLVISTKQKKKKKKKKKNMMMMMMMMTLRKLGEFYTR